MSGRSGPVNIVLKSCGEPSKRMFAWPITPDHPRHKRSPRWSMSTVKPTGLPRYFPKVHADSSSRSPLMTLLYRSCLESLQHESMLLLLMACDNAPKDGLLVSLDTAWKWARKAQAEQQPTKSIHEGVVTMASFRGRGNRAPVEAIMRCLRHSELANAIDIAFSQPEYRGCDSHVLFKEMAQVHAMGLWATFLRRSVAQLKLLRPFLKLTWAQCKASPTDLSIPEHFHANDLGVPLFEASLSRDPAVDTFYSPLLPTPAKGQQRWLMFPAKVLSSVYPSHFSRQS
ncbi:hypothetical protein DL93DRAFT_372859 [Clavulina sp. PMI_390]|nr:hypothetical protein DL93DRAFT_372859 [Clavulina sp. PMI_390]